MVEEVIAFIGGVNHEASIGQDVAHVAVFGHPEACVVFKVDDFRPLLDVFKLALVGVCHTVDFGDASVSMRGDKLTRTVGVGVD